MVRAFAKELVDNQPDIVVAQGSTAVQALLQETHTIPIVFVQVIDPVGQGFTAGMAHPGGNVTGFSIFEELDGRQVARATEGNRPRHRASGSCGQSRRPHMGLF